MGEKGWREGRWMAAHPDIAPELSPLQQLPASQIPTRRGKTKLEVEVGSFLGSKRPFPYSRRQMKLPWPVWIWRGRWSR